MLLSIYSLWFKATNWDLSDIKTNSEMDPERHKNNKLTYQQRYSKSTIRVTASALLPPALGPRCWWRRSASGWVPAAGHCWPALLSRFHHPEPQEEQPGESGNPPHHWPCKSSLTHYVAGHSCPSVSCPVFLPVKRVFFPSHCQRVLAHRRLFDCWVWNIYFLGF